MRRSRHVICLALLILIISGFISGSIVSGGDYSSVGIGTREEIPDNLPWYPVIVFGDNRPDHSGEVEFNPVTYDMRDEFIVLNPFAVIGVGDHVWNGYVDQIQHLMETFKDVPNVWVVAGNHEWNNKPYIDDSNREGVEYWRQHVSPDLYYKDDIPGWRIVFINLRLGYMDWTTVENWLRNDAFKTDRHLIVAFHEPVAPNREASKAIRSVQSKLIPILDSVDPDIVVQGHIHCYDEGYRGPTLYMITGGGGAPKCKRYPYHYVVFVLKPSGDYEYIPVSITDGKIAIYEHTSENYTHLLWKYTVLNTKKDIYGHQAWIPIRINFEINGKEYGLVAIYGNSETEVDLAYNKESGELHIEYTTSNTPLWSSYPPYFYNSTNTWIINGSTATITLINLEKTSPITTTTTTTSSNGETTTTSTSPKTTTNNQEDGDKTSTSTSTSNNGFKITNDQLLLITYALLGVMVVEVVILYLKKRR